MERETVMSSQEFGEALIAEVRRRLFGESVPRMLKCLDALTDEEIWSRPNDETVSVGNLVLHLCGNARQWICSGLGGGVDRRVRSQEFEERGPIPRARLLEQLEETTRDVEEVLGRIAPDSLLEQRPVQIYSESGLSILIHVVEHFSYHVGQITYSVKSRKGIDMGYYKGAPLGGKTAGQA